MRHPERRAFPSLTPPRRGRFELCPLIAVLTLTFACTGPESGDNAADSAFTVRDSLGVQIVDTRAPVGPGSEWVVGDTPTIRIEGRSPELPFGEVSRVAVSGSGRVAVVDRLRSEVAVFDEDGGFLYAVGREGEGPGEFSGAPYISWGGQDSVIAWDPRGLRISWFDSDGGFARQESLLWAVQDEPDLGIPGIASDRWHVSPDGALLSLADALERESAAETIRRKRLHLVDRAAARVVELGTYGAERFLRVGPMSFPDDYAHQPAATLSVDSDGPVGWIAPGPEWELHGLNAEGNLARLVRIHRARVPVSAEMERANAEKWEGLTGNAEMAALWEDASDRFALPDSLPAIHSILVDNSGRLWVRRRVTPTGTSEQSFVILEPTGRWIASVEVPSTVGLILAVTDRWVVARSAGEFGEPGIEVFALERR